MDKQTHTQTNIWAILYIEIQKNHILKITFTIMFHIVSQHAFPRLHLHLRCRF